MGSNTVTAKQLEVQRIADALFKAIAQHRLPPGTRLVEAQIVETLQANRNHVQVALQRLAMQKVVTIEANRGAMVSQPTVGHSSWLSMTLRTPSVDLITPGAPLRPAT